jgi:hypothetical protein
MACVTKRRNPFGEEGYHSSRTDKTVKKDFNTIYGMILLFSSFTTIPENTMKILMNEESRRRKENISTQPTIFNEYYHGNHSHHVQNCVTCLKTRGLTLAFFLIFSSLADVIPCSYCGRSNCELCVRQCQQCLDVFCTFCSTCKLEFMFEVPI